MTQITPKPNSENGYENNSLSPWDVQVEGATSQTTRNGHSPTPDETPTSLPSKRGRRLFLTSLRSKVTALAIAIGTVPVLVVGITAYFTAGRGIEQQIVQNELTNAIDLEDKLNNFVRERYEDIQELATRQLLTNPKLQESATEQIKTDSFDNFLKISKVYDNIALADLTGKVIVQSEEGEKAPASIADDDYFQAVLKTDRPFISEPEVSEVTGAISLFVAAPVKDSVTGKTFAIIRTRLPMANFAREVFGITDDRGQDFYLSDSNGQIVATDKTKFLNRKLEEEFPKLFSQKQDRTERFLETITVHDNEEKIETYLFNEKLAKTYGLNWSLIVTRPTSVALAPQRQLLLAIALATGAVIAIVASLAALFATRAIRPILDAANAVDKIGQGKLDTRLSVTGEDELATLGSNINKMAGQLETLLQEQTLAAEEQRQLKEEQRQLKEDLQQRALELLQEVDPIGKGDLTIRAKVTADEIGTIADSYNATVSNLRKIVLQVQDAANQVAETTATNETTVQSLSVEALRQAEEIARALERAQEMAQSVQQVAKNAEQAEAAIKQAAQTVEEGDRAMNRTVDGILAIRETVAETAKKVKHLGESSQKISTVVNLISTFAAQTNLLALNASIEAARAGEEGRGFAVVADEVRALARQSAEATNEIEKLVAAIQAETNEVVAAMEAGTEQVVMGTKLVDETRASLNKITTASAHINELVEAIAQATVVQSQASEAVTQTMTNVASSADKTSQEASNVSSSFQQLLQVARDLLEDVGRFKVS